MQDIVFYAAANETLGVVRDYANARKMPAPVLTLGVSVCLRMRLFSDLDTATPYPITAFSGITNWQWRMDGDFDQATTCKLAADANGISVHSVTDTVNGESITFSEFVIPISNMNTQELTAWLGNEKKRSGLVGELVGYDSSEKAAFVLQIENFTVRNRVAGLGNPTAVELETVTYDQAGRLIQTAVTASANTKQDKFTTGDLLELTSATLNRRRYMPVVNEADMSRRSVTPAGSTASVQALVLEPGNAYKINAVSTNKWFATSEAFKGTSDQWGLESHIELFVAGTGFIHADTNVALATALKPDAVNNCTVRFHDGRALISVEDTIAGYIVVSANGSTAGTLPYALTADSQEYVAFDNALSGLLIDMGGAVTNGEKHVVGNGYSETILSGGITCTSKTTFSNLSLDGVVNSGGTMTLGDVCIPSGATLRANGGSFAIEKVTGNGGVIDLGGTNVPVPSSATVHVSGVVFSSGYADPYGGVFNVGSGAAVTVTNCTFAGNSATFRGGVAYTAASASLTFSGCSFLNNGSAGAICLFGSGAICRIVDCEFASDELLRSYGNTRTVYSFAGNNVFLGRMLNEENYSVVISSGAVIDLTGNTNATPIAPSDGVIFEVGGATVYPSAGSASAVTMSGGTFTSIGNDGVLHGLKRSGNQSLSGNATIDMDGGATRIDGISYFNGLTYKCGTNGLTLYNGDSLSLENCVVSCSSGRAVRLAKAQLNISNCSFEGAGGGIYMVDGGTPTVTIGGSNAIVRIFNNETSGTVTISDGASINLTSGIVPGGGVTFEQGSATIIPRGSSALAYALGGMTVPQIGNTNTVNLNNSNVVISGGTAYASGCTFTGGSATSAGACFRVNGGELHLDKCTVTSGQCTYGGIYASGADVNVYLTSTVVSGNVAPDLGLYAATAHVSDCTIGSASFEANASLEINGSNRIAKITGGGTVTISSGATIDLTGNSTPLPVAPDGGITLHGGAGHGLDEETKILYTSNGNTYSRTFEDVEIRGTSITNLGTIFGATVTIPGNSTYSVSYIGSGGTTSGTATVTGATTYVLDTEIGTLTGLAGVTNV